MHFHLICLENWNTWLINSPLGLLYKAVNVLPEYLDSQDNVEQLQISWHSKNCFLFMIYV